MTGKPSAEARVSDLKPAGFLTKDLYLDAPSQKALSQDRYPMAYAIKAPYHSDRIAQDSDLVPCCTPHLACVTPIWFCYSFFNDFILSLQKIKSTCNAIKEPPSGNGKMVLRLLLQILDEHTSDRIQNRQNHDAYVCRNRNPHVRESERRQNEAPYFYT